MISVLESSCELDVERTEGVGADVERSVNMVEYKDLSQYSGVIELSSYQFKCNLKNVDSGVGLRAGGRPASPTAWTR